MLNYERSVVVCGNRGTGKEQYVQDRINMLPKDAKIKEIIINGEEFDYEELRKDLRGYDLIILRNLEKLEELEICKKNKKLPGLFVKNIYDGSSETPFVGTYLGEDWPYRTYSRYVTTPLYRKTILEHIAKNGEEFLSTNEKLDDILYEYLVEYGNDIEALFRDNLLSLVHRFSSNIVWLNKEGYRVFSSNSNHYRVGRTEYYIDGKTYLIDETNFISTLEILKKSLIKGDEKQKAWERLMNNALV